MMNWENILSQIESLPVSVFVIVAIAAFFGIVWWLKTTIAQERKRDMDDIRNEVTGVIGPALDKIVHILELQDQINRDLQEQSKIAKFLSGKSEDGDSD